MQCGKCGSDNTQRLEVTYNGGSQDVQATSRTVGVGSISGALGLSGSVTKTSGTAVSVLAQKAAPPAKKTFTAFIVIAVIGFFFLGGSIKSTLFGILLLAGGGYGIYNAVRFNLKNWPGLYRHWLGSWMCQKCGNIYHQE
mgnify:CR=1 FL=1